MKLNQKMNQKLEGALGSLRRVQNAFSDPEVVFYSNDEKEDKLHDVQVSLESIYAWKRHLLRAVHQDRARQEVLDEVDSSKIFITQDLQ